MTDSPPDSLFMDGAPWVRTPHPFLRGEGFELAYFSGPWGAVISGYAAQPADAVASAKVFGLASGSYVTAIVARDGSDLVIRGYASRQDAVVGHMLIAQWTKHAGLKAGVALARRNSGYRPRHPLLPWPLP